MSRMSVVYWVVTVLRVTTLPNSYEVNQLQVSFYRFNGQKGDLTKNTSQDKCNNTSHKITDRNFTHGHKIWRLNKDLICETE